VLFVAEKNKGRRRNEVRSSGHKSNITNKFIDEFKSVGNLICKNDTSSYFLTFFSFFFSPPYFSQYILREYFCQCLLMNLIREYSIDKIHHNLLIIFFLSMFLFVFVNFLVVHWKTKKDLFVRLYQRETFPLVVLFCIKYLFILKK